MRSSSRWRVAMAAAAVMLAASEIVFAPPGGGGGVTWENIGGGIDYARIDYTVNTTNPPQVVHVARFTRGTSAAFIEAVQAENQQAATESVPDQVTRWDDAINYWGNGGTDHFWGFRNDVKVAINGNFFSEGTPILTGGILHAGSYDKRFTDFTGEGVFLFHNDGTPYISKDVLNRPAEQYVIMAASPAINPQVQIGGLNELDRPADKLVLYTPQFGAATPAGCIGSSVEILVEMDTPAGLVGGVETGVPGTIKLVRQGTGIGSTPIPFGNVVLSACGSAATELLGYNPQEGMAVQISQKILECSSSACTNGSYGNFSNVYSGTNGNRIVLYASKMPLDPLDSKNTVRDSRTAVAYNSTYIFFVVADWNPVALPRSEGMTLIELGNFCKDRNTLNASHAVNLDGGISSTMWVEGKGVVNAPDSPLSIPWGVASSLMMVSETYRGTSTKFLPGDLVQVQNSTLAYTGPGTNFTDQGPRLMDNIGTIQDYPTAGVYAKGLYWWPVKFQDDIAPVWVNGADLRWLASGPNTILIDDGDPGFSRAGSGWTYYSAQPDSLNGDHWDLCCSIPTFPTGSYAEYRPTITEPGEYKVEYYTAGSRTGMEDWNIFEVHYYDPATAQWTSEPYWLWPTIVNANWERLGEGYPEIRFFFPAGTGGYVRISNGTGIPFQSAGYSVRADAVRFTRIGPMP